VIFEKMRDLKMIGYKLKYVLLPKMREDSGKELRNCNKHDIKNISRRLFYNIDFSLILTLFDNINRGSMGTSPTLSLLSHVKLKKPPSFN